MSERNHTTFSHEDIKDILERLNGLIPANGYTARGKVDERTVTVTFEFDKERNFQSAGMPFFNFAQHAPLLAWDLLAQLDQMMSEQAP